LVKAAKDLSGEADWREASASVELYRLVCLSGIAEVVFVPPCRVEEINGFNGCQHLMRIAIPASVRRIAGFSGLSWTGGPAEWVPLGAIRSALTSVMFAPGSRLRELEDFCGCEIRKLVVPAAVKVLKGFGDVRLWNDGICCDMLRKLVFPPDSHLRELRGFDWWNALDHIEIRPSVDVIGAYHRCDRLSEGFSPCGELKTVVFGPNGRLRRIEPGTFDYLCEWNWFRMSNLNNNIV
jgi:hypothetical protein